MARAFSQLNYEQKFLLSGITGTNSFLHIFNSTDITFLNEKKNKHIYKNYNLYQLGILHSAKDKTYKIAVGVDLTNPSLQNLNIHDTWQYLKIKT